MGWANKYIEALSAGETVKFRPRGKSMTGKVDDGSLVTVVPLGSLELSVGDVVLCKVNGAQYLHLVKAIRDNGEQYLIGNNRGGTNGWVSRRSVFGKCIAVEK
jgi:SOS-response transcriptional repressor LexA